MDYRHEWKPFIFAPGNVRVILDYNIRTRFHCSGLGPADNIDFVDWLVYCYLLPQ